VRGTEILSQKRACVVVANHQSSFDSLGMFWICDWMKRCSAVAKKEIFYVWPFGLALWLSGTIFINRLNTKQAKQQLHKAAEYALFSIEIKQSKLFLYRNMKKLGNKLWFFPEGTRNRKRCLLPFKKGAFHVAIACQAPIMPVVYSPYYFINPHNKFFDTGKLRLS
jgi:lysophosphatidate acyltransferase